MTQNHWRLKNTQSDVKCFNMDQKKIRVTQSDMKWLSDSKWLQMTQNDSKWLKVTQSESKWIKVNQSDSVSQSDLKSLWVTLTQWVKVTQRDFK